MGVGMTEQELAAIEARCNAATPGPWNRAYHGNMIIVESPNSIVVNADDKEFGTGLQYGGIKGETDGDFIANSRTDVPALLAEVRRLMAEVEHLRTPGPWLATVLPRD